MDRWIDMREDTTRTRGRARLVCTLVGLIMIGRSGHLGCELGSLLRHRKCTEGMSSISHTSTRTHMSHTHTPTHAHIHMGHARGPHTSGRVLKRPSRLRSRHSTLAATLAATFQPHALASSACRCRRREHRCRCRRREHRCSAAAGATYESRMHRSTCNH